MHKLIQASNGPDSNYTLSCYMSVKHWLLYRSSKFRGILNGCKSARLCLLSVLGSLSLDTLLFWDITGHSLYAP